MLDEQVVREAVGRGATGVGDALVARRDGLDEVGVGIAELDAVPDPK